MLNVGKIYHSGDKVYLRVESFMEVQTIIDHFDTYPLVTAKKLDFILFKQCYNIIKQNEHLTEKGIFKLIELKANLNKGLSDGLKNMLNLPEKPMEFKFEGIPHPFWVAGFVSGDGSFNIKNASQSNRVQLRFSVILHIREEEVIKGLFNFFFKQFLGDEIQYIHYTKNSLGLQVVNFSHIINIIIPFFQKYPIQGIKSFDFNDFCKIAEIVKNKEHLTLEGLEKIKQIKEGMNLKRK